MSQDRTQVPSTNADSSQFPTAPLSESAAAALKRLERAFAPKAVA